MSEPNIETVNPALYQDPRVISRSEHAELKILGSSDFSFAANLPTIPLVVSEFAVASADYPIIFVAGESDTTPMPMAITSLSAEQNDFVTSNGKWREDSYIPAYVRRYPFVFTSDDASGNLVLCVDMASDRISDGDEGISLFSDGEPSDTTSRILSFCNNFQRDHAVTQQFAETLSAMGLLRAERITIRVKDKQTKVLEGVSLLDREAFKTLDNESFLKLREQGYLGLIYAHLSSLHRLRQLAV